MHVEVGWQRARMMPDPSPEFITNRLLTMYHNHLILLSFIRTAPQDTYWPLALLPHFLNETIEATKITACPVVENVVIQFMKY